MPARKRDHFYAVVDRASATINDIAAGADRESIADWAPKVIAAFEGSADAFQQYDTYHWREPGFWMARSIRNSPIYGEQLFSSFHH